MTQNRKPPRGHLLQALAFFSLAWGPTLASTGYLTATAPATRSISTGAELPAALLDGSVSTIVLLQDVSVSEQHWRALPQQLPLVLSADRNVTIMSDARAAHACVLDFQFAANKVQLLPGASLHFKRVALAGIKPLKATTVYGLDILAVSPEPQPGQEHAFVAIEECYLQGELCLPAKYAAGSAAVLQRAPGFPGLQRIIVTPYNSCTSSGRPPPPPPPPQWTEANGSQAMACALDVASVGQVTGEGGMVILSNWYGRVQRTMLTCRVVVNDSCVQQLGILGCWQQTVQQLIENGHQPYNTVLGPGPPASSALPQLPSNSPQPVPPAAPAPMPPAEVPTPKQEPPSDLMGTDTNKQAGAKNGTGSDDGGGDGDGELLRILLPSVIGGLALIALLVLAALLVRHRRRRLLSVKQEHGRARGSLGKPSLGGTSAELCSSEQSGEQDMRWQQQCRESCAEHKGVAHNCTSSSELTIMCTPTSGRPGTATQNGSGALQLCPSEVAAVDDTNRMMASADYLRRNMQP